MQIQIRGGDNNWTDRENISSIIRECMKKWPRINLERGNMLQVRT